MLTTLKLPPSFLFFFALKATSFEEKGEKKIAHKFASAKKMTIELFKEDATT